MRSLAVLALLALIASTALAHRGFHFGGKHRGKIAFELLPMTIFVHSLMVH